MSWLVRIYNADVFLNGNQVLKAIDWTMKKNENWAVVGVNGAGKTSFMRLIFGELIPIHGGGVRWFGNEKHGPLNDARKRIGFVSADFQENYAPTTLCKNVVISGFFSSIGLYKKANKKQKEIASYWMEFLGIQSLENKSIGKISYGEARRILLARALINLPDLLILDEPCSGLDIPTKELFLQTLDKLAKTKTQLIYVTHHIDEILPLTTHVLFLKNGTIFSKGTKSKMLTGHQLSKAFGCHLKLKKTSGRYWVTESRL
ncbi:MAG: ATP-binding cassette domain-containing protein [Nitrospina sp.]|jgi:iron complex transport system ATP-binding protein|nr:ATP-binding cassette domain-containing protein [Nitrospina sp.]MBT6600870.1 ATP-binding cassette domain-containing protein [Nitrospina sp.]